MIIRIHSPSLPAEPVSTVYGSNSQVYGGGSVVATYSESACPMQRSILFRVSGLELRDLRQGCGGHSSSGLL